MSASQPDDDGPGDIEDLVDAVARESIAWTHPPPGDPKISESFLLGWRVGLADLPELAAALDEHEMPDALRTHLRRFCTRRWPSCIDRKSRHWLRPSSIQKRAPRPLKRFEA